MLGALKFVSRDELEKESSEKVAKKRKHREREKGKLKRRGKKKGEFEDDDSSSSSSGDEDGADQVKEEAAVEIREDAKARRKEAGMDWMLRAPERLFERPAPSVPETEPAVHPEELPVHPRELNPYIKSGAEEGEQQAGRPGPPMVGDGGASWRLKALKRAQEQAAREGRKLDEVVEERWGSLGSLTSSVAVRRSAHANAHLHAIRDRRLRGEPENSEERASQRTENRSVEGKNRERGRYADREQVSRMRVPQLDSSLSWRSKKKYENRPLRTEDAAVVRAAASSMNKFANDGSFLKNFKPIELSPADMEPEAEDLSSIRQPERDGGSSSKILSDIAELRRIGGIASDDSGSDSQKASERKSPVESGHKAPTRSDTGANSSAGLTANQVAAKAMRLRLMGKVEEADKLTRDFESSSREIQVSGTLMQDSDSHTYPVQSERQGSGSGVGMSLTSAQPRDKIRDRNRTYDAELAGSIARNKSYKGRVDDEYDYGDGCDMEGSGGKKVSKKSHGRPSVRSRGDGVNRIITQQERCQFCFENADRPKYLVIAIANSTYLMIPPRTSLVPFHCFIVPMQHEGATRNVDESVWQELRNFKKCLVQMFAKQGKEVLFLETAMELARQRKHCYVECIPVPSDAAKDAPLYFKKAIDEAEDEWSQHNAKKLIDTRDKGLRNSIPKNFPYFHVEFGMKGGYAHVIDDESSFKSQFGRDVVAGLLELPEEETYGSRRPESVEQQKKRVAEFLKLWEPFDWTKMLD
ncbi:hypothetical protein R1flu_014551 [Riccia fluitans]|uniref:CWF19-like protein 2 n=1 Tax=Riccia fluitans TaxID=41844 RepID=A0ABD1YGS3_9MARC